MSTATRGAVTHFYGHAAVVDECCHGIYLERVGRTGERVCHSAPLVGGVFKVGAQCAVEVAFVAVGPVSLFGVFPIVHDLSHGGGSATGDSLSGIGGGPLWTEFVVVRRLGPSGGHQRRNAGGVRRGVFHCRGLRVGVGLPLAEGGLVGFDVVVDCISDFVV